jgi:hypothetical protein
MYKLKSKCRWTSGSAVKARYGSATVTEFWVHQGNWLVGTVIGYGKSPTDRKKFGLASAQAGKWHERFEPINTDLYEVVGEP